MARIQTLGKGDDWTIERWRTEPRLVGLKFSETLRETAPPLWKDLALAAIVVAVALLAVAALAGV